MDSSPVIVSPFNEKFCARLEFRLCAEFIQVADPALKGFWCDGISWMENEAQLDPAYISENRKIITKAWLGKTGQVPYKAIIHFGTAALAAYVNGASLNNAIPNLETTQRWIEIDTENQIIELRLN